MKLALIGRSMISPFGFAIRPRIPASWRICLNDPRAPELAIMKIGFSSSRLSSIACATSSVARSQSTAQLLLAVLLGEQPVVVLALDLRHLLLVAVEDLLLVRRRDDVVLRDRDPGLAREVEPELLERVERLRDRRGAVGLDEVGDDLVDRCFFSELVDELVLLRIPLVAERLRDRALDPVVEDDPPDRGQEVLVTGAPVLGLVVELDDPVLVGELGLLGGAIDVRTAAVRALRRLQLRVDLRQVLGVGP